MRKNTWLSWSSGKDSAWALHVLRQSGEYEVSGLFTTINTAFDRVAMHAVRVDLLRRQAQAVGLPLYLIEIPYPCSDEQYAAAMENFMARARDEDVRCMAFGDLYLQDIRRYREERMQGSGIAPVFPLWEMPTRALLEEMLAGGLRACLTCVDPRVLPAKFAGRELTLELLASMPSATDPCGENGEFHSFVFDGPMFARPLDIEMGEVVERDGFVFADCRLRGTVA
ncbi:MAG: adenine nucleotide alpha hydrolase [Gammaproteobacteria bacterium]|nr:adenine nucleotide alpha hydrolase [Gammaproteobacteria bacterium]MBU1481644.1 adenine nucleotide alpha hydrolase [Gammaproteobacteria bacterium]